MKKIFILALVLISFIGRSATFNWTGAVDTDFSKAGNWNLGLSGIPGGGDDVVFGLLGGSNNCVVSSTLGLSLNSISLQSGYTGIVSLGSNNHQIANISIASGTLVSSSGIVEMDVASNSNITFSLGSGGTFSHNNGSIDLYPNTTSTVTFSGNLTLNILNLFFNGGTAASAARLIDFGTNLITHDIIFNATAARIYDFQGTLHVKNSLDLGNAAYTTTSSANAGNFIFDGTGATIIGSTSTGAGKAYLPNIEINVGAGGTYSVTRSLNILGNWTGTTGNIVSGASTVNLYGSSATINGAAAFDNLALQSGASITFPASTEIFINKNFSVASGATATFPAGNVLGFNGTSQTISGSFTPQNITIHSGVTTLSSALTLVDALTVATGATFSSGGLLTLHADAAGTARVAESGGTISGNVNVETFLTGGTTGWANLGTPGVQGQSIASWDTYGSSGGANGIPMTCYGCMYAPANAAGFMSIEGWDASTQDYDTSYVTINSATALDPGKGFWVYVGDGSSSTNSLKLLNSGAVVSGPQSLQISSNFGDYNLIANPYPSPISWDAVYSAGLNGLTVDAAIYAWNADNGVSTSYVSGVGGTPGAPNGIDNIIPAAQGFYVTNAGLSFTSLDFDETMKIANPGNNPVIKPSGVSTQSFRLKLNGSLDWDGMLFSFNSNATSFYDKKYDAHKIFQSPGYMGYPGAYDKYTTISCKDAFDVDYSIHSMAPLTESVSIPVLARVSASGTYTISAYDFKNFTSCIGLKDRTTNTFHDLRQSDYIFTISDTTSAPRFYLVLCRDESINVTGIAQLVNSSSILINQDQQGAFVKTAFSRNTKATISAYNIIGQKLMEDISVEGTATNTRLNLDMQNQIVIIRVVTDKESSTKKMVMH